MSDLLPNIRESADELCVLHSVYAINPNHSPAANFLATGRIDAVHPELGRGFPTALVPRTRTFRGSSPSGADSVRRVLSVVATCRVSFRRHALLPRSRTPRR